MSVKQRLDLIVKELGISGRSFEKECGLANGSYSSIRDGVGVDKLNKILFRYPQISPDWLLSGKGEMLRESSSSHVALEPAVTENQGDDLNTILFKLSDIIDAQQKAIERLVTEIEQNGKRTDRIIEMICANS